MHCPKCKGEMIWGSDFDDDEIEGRVSSFYSCNNCDTEVMIYWGVK